MMEQEHIPPTLLSQVVYSEEYSSSSEWLASKISWYQSYWKHMVQSQEACLCSKSFNSLWAAKICNQRIWINGWSSSLKACRDNERSYNYAYPE